MGANIGKDTYYHDRNFNRNRRRTTDGSDRLNHFNKDFSKYYDDSYNMRNHRWSSRNERSSVYEGFSRSSSSDVTTPSGTQPTRSPREHFTSAFSPIKEPAQFTSGDLRSRNSPPGGRPPGSFRRQEHVHA